MEAKVQFLSKIFNNRNDKGDLYGGEDEFVERIYTGDKILATSLCSTCNRQVKDTVYTKLSIEKYQPTVDMKSYIEDRLLASSVQVHLLCCDKVIKKGTCNFRCNKPWMLLLSANSPRELKTFTMDKLLQLPLTVEHPEIGEIYFLAGVTFHAQGHFVSAIRYASNWLYYDGLNQAEHSCFNTLPEILKKIAETNAMLGTVVYLRQ